MRLWQEVRPFPLKSSSLDKESAWEADSAEQAFKLAVIENSAESVESTAYRVLPYTGGVTFNLSVNVEDAAHES